MSNGEVSVHRKLVRPFHKYVEKLNFCWELPNFCNVLLVKVEVFYLCKLTHLKTMVKQNAKEDLI